MTIHINPKWDPVFELPPEIALYIFSFLDEKSLSRANQVCATWHCFTNDHLLWQEVAKKIKEMFHGQIPRNVNIRNLIIELDQQRARTNDEVIDHFQAFMGKVCLGQEARFRCIIGVGKGFQTISIEIKCNKEIEDDEPFYYDTKEDCFINQISNYGQLNIHKSANKPYDFSLMRLCFTRSQISGAERIYTLPFENSSSLSSLSYQGILRFPNLQNTSFDNPSDMELKIQMILKEKIEDLNEQEPLSGSILPNNMTSITYATAATAALVCAAFIYKR